MDPMEFQIDMGMAGVALASIKPLALQMLRILVVDMLANSLAPLSNYHPF